MTAAVSVGNGNEWPKYGTACIAGSRINWRPSKLILVPRRRDEWEVQNGTRRLGSDVEIVLGNSNVVFCQPCYHIGRGVF
jgi:hypothetical protein